jgi:hypothetical protein
VEIGLRGSFAHSECGRVAQNDRRGKSNALEKTSAGKFFVVHSCPTRTQQGKGKQDKEKGKKRFGQNKGPHVSMNRTFLTERFSLTPSSS